MNMRGHVSSAGSAMIHGGILLVLIAASYLHVEALGEPAVRQPGPLRLVLPAPAADPAAKAPGRPAPGAVRMKKATLTTEPPREAAPPQQQPPDVEPLVPREAAGVEGDPQAGIEVATGGDGGDGAGDQPGATGGGPGGDGAGVDGGPAGSGAGGDGPIYMTGEVRPPRRTAFVKPEYPEVARRGRVEGKVILEIVVGRTGEIEDIRVLRSAPLFDQAAIEAVARWRYQPALQDGRPVRVYLTVIVEFGLE